jgi:hypothetical protein
MSSNTTLKRNNISLYETTSKKQKTSPIGQGAEERQIFSIGSPMKIPKKTSSMKIPKKHSIGEPMKIPKKTSSIKTSIGQGAEERPSYFSIGVVAKPPKPKNEFFRPSSAEVNKMMEGFKKNKELEKLTLNDSNTILDYITASKTIKHDFIRRFRQCMAVKHHGHIRTDWDVPKSDIYWFTNDNKLHLSLHFGTSKTVEGAFHVKFTSSHRTGAFPLTGVFPIKTYLIKQRAKESIDEYSYEGRHIEMSLIDINTFYPYPEEFTYLKEILYDIFHCLDEEFARIISSHHKGGKNKTFRMSRNKNKTRKNKK